MPVQTAHVCLIGRINDISAPLQLGTVYGVVNIMGLIRKS